MKVLQVNYGWPPRQTGGPVGYVAELSRNLAELGCEVGLFLSGNLNFLVTPYVKRDTEADLTLFHLCNSPLLLNLSEPRAELSNTLVEKRFMEVVAQFSPDIVHFHNFVGLCFSLIELANRAGCKTIVSLHNYLLLCRRGDFLIPPNYTLCEGPGDGSRCALCTAPAGRQGRRTFEIGKRILKDVLKKNVGMKRALQKAIHLKNTTLHSWAPGLDRTATGGDILGSTSLLRPGDHGPDRLMRLPDAAFVSDFLHRRRYTKESLNKYSDLIIAVSSAVKEIFVRHEIDERKIEVVHSGIKFARIHQNQPRRSVSRNVPICFGFFGPVQPYKGVHVLVDAFSTISPEKARLLIFGTGDTGYLRSLMARAGSNVRFMGAFSHLPDILDQMDVVVVPPIWPDNSPLVVLEAQTAKKPIIGSNIGGVKDFVVHGYNGRLFNSGDAKDLAHQISFVIDNPLSIDIMAERTQKPKDDTEHASELVSIYQRLLRT